MNDELLTPDEAQFCNFANRCRWQAYLGAWLALHHPQSGSEMRAAVSDSIRHENKAHVTVHLGPGALGIALAESFVDLEKLTAMAPGPVMAVTLRPEAETLQ